MSHPPLAAQPTYRQAARTANPRAAAERLHRTHNAVRRRTRQLDDRLGFQLVERRMARWGERHPGIALDDLPLHTESPALQTMRQWLRDEMDLWRALLVGSGR